MWKEEKYENQTVFEIIIQQWETQNMHLLTLHAVTPKISPSQMFGDRSTEHLSLNRHDVKRTWIVFSEEFRDIKKAVTSIWQIEVEKEQTWVLTTQTKKHILVRLLKRCSWERSGMLSNINLKSGQMPCEKETDFDLNQYFKCAPNSAHIRMYVCESPYSVLTSLVSLLVRFSLWQLLLLVHAVFLSWSHVALKVHVNKELIARLL